MELVEHDFAAGITLELDDNAHALPITLVTQVGDAFDPLLTDKIGDPFDHRRLVDLIGNGHNDDGVAILANLLDGGDAANHH